MAWNFDSADKKIIKQREAKSNDGHFSWWDSGEVTFTHTKVIWHDSGYATMRELWTNKVPLPSPDRYYEPEDESP
jgi:hypothetical protein